MTIQYNVSMQDYINFNIDHNNNMKSQRIARVVLRFFIVPVLLLLFFFNDNNLSPIEMIVTGIFSFVWIIFSPSLMEKQMCKSLKKYIENGKGNDFIGNQTIQLTDDYIETINATTQSKIQYAAIERICTGHQLYYIYIGAVKALIVPYTAFQNSDMKNLFFEIIYQKTGLGITA